MDQDEHDVTCPNCGHVFTPSGYEITGVEDQADGGVIVTYRSVVGFGDIPTIRTLRLEGGINVERNGEIFREAKDWTPEEVEDQVRRAQDELLAHLQPTPEARGGAARTRYGALVGRRG